MASEEIITKISSSLMYSPLRPRDFIILFVQYYSRICCPSDHTMGRPYSPKIEPGWSINVGTLTTRSPLLLFSQMSLWIVNLCLKPYCSPFAFILSYICPCGSESGPTMVLNRVPIWIRIRIHNTQHNSLHKDNITVKSVFMYKTTTKLVYLWTFFL